MSAVRTTRYRTVRSTPGKIHYASDRFRVLGRFVVAWTLLVLRDIMFGGKRHFRELLQSDEHIASNILADRLARLVENGVLTKSDDPTHKQKAIYSLTEKGIGQSRRKAPTAGRNE